MTHPSITATGRVIHSQGRIAFRNGISAPLAQLGAAMKEVETTVAAVRLFVFHMITTKRFRVAPDSSIRMSFEVSIPW